MTASPGMTYINDAVGNRIARNYTPGQAGAPNSDARMYVWDELNRMTATAGATAGKGYRNIFRADGMRVQKIDDIDLEFTENQEVEDGSGFYDAIYHENKPTTRYFYDGQMCFEDERTEYVGETPQVTKTRYGLGARGIDYISKQVGSGSLVESFPVYDSHGNMVMTLSRDGTSFSDGLHRSYDVWGSLRWNPSSSSEVKQRYCANLGHVEDDESGLQYMRARFYEPWTGRFVSEDSARDGLNWFAYCDNDPVSKVDASGKCSLDVLMAFAIGFAIAYLIALSPNFNNSAALLAGLVNGIASAAISAASSAYGKAALNLTLSTTLAGILKVSTGAALNIAASFLISLITDDDFGLMEVILGGFAGGVGGGVGGQVGFADDIVIGGFTNSVPSATEAFTDFIRQ